MSRDYFVLNRGRVVYAPGHYLESDADEIAKNAAKRFPGRTFKVVQLLSTYQFPRKKKKS